MNKIPIKRFVANQTEYDAIVFNRFDSITKPIDFLATVKYEGTPYCLFNAEDGVYAVRRDSNYHAAVTLHKAFNVEG